MSGGHEVGNDPWTTDATTYRGSSFRSIPTWGYLLVVVWLALVLLGISDWFNRVLLVVVLLMAARAWWLTRTTSMTVSRAGVERRNDARGYLLRIPWADIEGIERSRVRLLRMWCLHYSPQALLPLDPAGKVSPRSVSRATRLGLYHRFPLRPFIGDPRSSPFAERLAAMRPDLSGGTRS